MANRYTSKHTTVTFEDNAGNTITAGPGPGDLSVSGIEADNAAAISVKNRGAHDGWVEGDDLEQDWTLTLGLVNQSISSASAARIMDWIRRANYYDPTTGTVKLQSVDSAVWAFKVIVTMNDGTTSSVWTLGNNRVGASAKEAVDGWTLSLTGKNVGSYTFA